MLRRACLLLGCAVGVVACETTPAVPATSAPPATGHHLGPAFTAAPEVPVSDLVSKSDEYRGKTVQVTGRVTAMCTHRKEWFAVVPENTSDAFIRVVTAPGFLVPDGSIGRMARAEGTVEVSELPADTAKHFLGEHKLGDPTTVAGPVKQVIVRATAAEFN